MDLSLEDNLSTGLMELALTAAQDINRRSQDVMVHSQCTQLAKRCTELVHALQSKQQMMGASALSEAMDESEEILLKVRKRITEWANLDRVKSIMRQDRIAADLSVFNQTINTHIAKFQILSSIELNCQQHEMDLCRQQELKDAKNMFLALVHSIEDIEADFEIRDNIPAFMVVIQEELRDRQPGTEEHETLRGCLNTLHVETGILPPLIDLTGQVVKLRGYPTFDIHTKDIYEGRWVGSETVMLKGIQRVEGSTIKQIHREVAAWRQLQHPHVLEFYGIWREGSRLFTVTPWEDNGNLLMYLQRHPECNWRRLLSEVALGLNYIHAFKPVIVHGDLRAANVLVSASGKALLAGFGINQIIAEEEGVDVVSAYLRKSGSLRWMAPELFDRGAGPSSVSISSDVWSFGMLCLELLTGHPPYSGCTSDEQVIAELARRGLPNRMGQQEMYRRETTDNMWILMQRCWAWRPELRPRTPVLVKDMNKLCEESRKQSGKAPRAQCNNIKVSFELEDGASGEQHRLRVYAWVHVPTDDVAVNPLGSLALELATRHIRVKLRWLTSSRRYHNIRFYCKSKGDAGV